MVWYGMAWYSMVWHGMVEVCVGTPVAVCPQQAQHNFKKPFFEISCTFLRQSNVSSAQNRRISEVGRQQKNQFAKKKKGPCLRSVGASRNPQTHAHHRQLGPRLQGYGRLLFSSYYIMQGYARLLFMFYFFVLYCFGCTAPLLYCFVLFWLHGPSLSTTAKNGGHDCRVTYVCLLSLPF